MIGQICVALLAAYYDMYTSLWALAQTYSLAQTLHTNVDTHTEGVKGFLVFLLITVRPPWMEMTWQVC